MSAESLEEGDGRMGPLFESNVIIYWTDSEEVMDTVLNIHPCRSMPPGKTKNTTVFHPQPP